MKVTAMMISLKLKSTSLGQAVSLLNATKNDVYNSALCLLVAMPKPGKIPNKDAAALEGLAPFNRDSGKMRVQRKMFGGRLEIRQALYMAVISGPRYKLILKDFHQRLLVNGKPKKSALAAVMRKLLCYLNALIKKVICHNLKPLHENPS